MRSVIWSIFEIAINIFQGFAFCFYSYKYLNKGKFKNFIFSSGTVFSLILAAVITFFNYITIFEHFWALLYSVIIFIYAIIKLNGTIINKAFSAIIPIFIMIISSAFITNFISVLFGIPFETILSGESLPRTLTLVSAQLIIVYLQMVSLKILNKGENNSSLNVQEWIIILSLLGISIFISAVLNFISLEGVSKRGHYFVVLIFFGVLLVNIMILYIVSNLSRANNVRHENQLLKLREEYNQQYISSANAEYEVIRRIRHDFKDNISAVYRLVEEDRKQEALKYMKGYLAELAEKEVFIKTNNPVVNAVINSKLSAAKSYGINIVCICISDFSGITDLDLCSLLSNILDNAVSACKSCLSESKRIYMNISADEYKYDFCVKNTISTSVLKNNPKLLTDKRNKKEHGLGVKIIKSISEKYEGKVDFYEESDEFCCRVILKKGID